MRVRSLLALFAGLGLIATACGRPTPVLTPVAPTPVAPVAPTLVAPTPAPVLKPAGELRIALGTLGAEVGDPTLGAGSDVKIFVPIYDFLVGATPDAQLSKAHGLARDWEVSHSPDSSTYTFYLREGIKFHNGDEVTAEDVKFSIEYFRREGSVATGASLLRETINRIETPERYKVVVKTKKAYALLLHDLSRSGKGEGMVLPKKYFEEKGAENFNINPVGTGFYRFKERVLGSYVKFEAVENHFIYGTPRWKTLTLFTIPEEFTRIAMLKLGQADVIEASRETTKELKLAGYNILMKSESVWVMLWLFQRQKDTYLYDRRVREALSLAINREEILEHLLAGYGRVSGDTYFGSWALGYKPLPLYPYDPKQATALLKEAFPGGVSLKYYSYSRYGVPELMKINEAIASMWKTLGVKVEIVPIDWAAFRALTARPGEELPNSLSGMVGSNRDIWLPSWYDQYHSTGRRTQTKRSDLDALMDALAAATTLEQIGERQYAVARFLRENHIGLPILATGEMFAVRPEKVTEWNLGNIQIDWNWPDLLKRR